MLQLRNHGKQPQRRVRQLQQGQYLFQLRNDLSFGPGFALPPVRLHDDERHLTDVRNKRNRPERISGLV